MDKKEASKLLDKHLGLLGLKPIRYNRKIYQAFLNAIDEATNEMPCRKSDSEQLPKNNCTLNRQTCGKSGGCKYPHCHL